MSLSSALSTAQSILSNTSTQTSIVSRNIANVGNPDYARRAADLATSGWGAQVVNISRAANDVLFRDNIASISAASGQNALLEGLDQIRALLGGNDYEKAPSTLIAGFRDTLQLFASKPGDASAAQNAIADAADVADGIRNASLSVQTQRRETDAEIARQVEELNKLLADFETANNDVKQATQTGADASDALDERDRLLRGISKIVGVTTVTRDAHDLAIYTKDGATLFETVPRSVTFERTHGFDASITGNPILIDGVPLRTGTGGATTASGSLGALLQLRDTIAPTYQAQLDEIARGLVTSFAETDPTGVDPAMPGLFTWAGGTLPADGTIEPGMAMSLTVNPAFVPPAGSPLLLRDGGANGATYVTNSQGAAGYSQRLDAYVTATETPTAFDPAARAGDSASLISYTADSIGWLEALRQQANQSAESKNAAYFRTTDALSNATGVNLDEEMSRLLDLEQSYKASSRLIAVVDEMLNTLLDAVR